MGTRGLERWLAADSEADLDDNGLSDDEAAQLLTGVPAYKPGNAVFVFYCAAFLTTFVDVGFVIPYYDWPHTVGGAFIYLTVINLALQCLFWLICLVDSVCYDRSPFWKDRFHKFRDSYFATLAFPVGLFVTIGFYTLILDFGHTLGSVLRANFDHGLTGLFIVVELVAVFHQYSSPNKMWLQALVSAAAGLAYAIWNALVRVIDGFWPYAFEDNLPLWLRIVSDLGFMVLIVIFYFFGRWATYKIHVRRGLITRTSEV